MKNHLPFIPQDNSMCAGPWTRRRTAAGIGAMLLGTLLPKGALSQSDRPVRLVVSNPAGGPIDIVARVIGDQLATKWKQGVLVDNRPGGNGIIAADLVAKSKPDGQTLLVTATFSESILPYAAEKLPYDGERDLVPVTEIIRNSFVLLVPASSPIRTFQDFVALAQSGKGRVSVGGLGRGSSLHMTWELMRKGAGIKDVEYIAYQGPGPAQVDLLGGQLAMSVDTYGSSRAFLENGRLRAIAVTSKTRAAVLPSVPTLDESGLKGFELVTWIGLVAPAGTPPDKLRSIQEAVAEALSQPAVRARMEQFGFEPVGSTAAAMASTIRAERQRYAPLVKELGISLQ